MGKTWRDYPNTTTPITAAALNDLERRVDTAVASSRKVEPVLTTVDELKRDVRTAKTQLAHLAETRSSAAETSQWSNSNLHLVKIGNVVHAVGTIRNATHATAGIHNNILVIPDAYRPSPAIYGDVCAVPAVSYTAGSGVPYNTDIAVNVNTRNGNVSMRCERNTTWAVVSASWAIA